MRGGSVQEDQVGTGGVPLPLFEGVVWTTHQLSSNDFHIGDCAFISVLLTVYIISIMTTCMVKVGLCMFRLNWIDCLAAVMLVAALGLYTVTLAITAVTHSLLSTESLLFLL